MNLLGREAVEAVVPKYMAILGADAAWRFEDRFCKGIHCPTGKFERFARGEMEPAPRRESSSTRRNRRTIPHVVDPAPEPHLLA